MKLYGGTEKMKRRLIVAAAENALFCGAMYAAIRLCGACMALLGL